MGGKKKHSKVMCFSTILNEAEIHTIPKIWKKRIPIVRENMEKHKHFKVMGFSDILGKADIQTISKIWKSECT